MHGVDQRLADQKRAQNARLDETRALVEAEGITDTATVAARLGVSQRSARRYLLEVGAVEPDDHRQQPPWTPELDAQALALLTDRAGYLETARSLGVTERRVSRRFPGYGLTRAESIERAMMAREHRDVL